MDNIINIIMSIVGILGTILAVLLAYSSYQKYNSEDLLEKMLIQLSDKYSDLIKPDDDFYERFYDISVRLEKYRYLYDKLQSTIEFANTTRKYCLDIGILMLILTILSLFLALCTTNPIISMLSMVFILFILFMLCGCLFVPLLNHLVPTVQPSRYPSPENLVSPCIELNINDAKILPNLPTRIFQNINIIKMWDSSSNNLPSYLDLTLIELDKKEYPSLATFLLPDDLEILPTFYGKLDFEFKKDGDSEPIKTELEFNDKKILKGYRGERFITIALKYPLDAIAGIRLALHPTSKYSSDNFIDFKYIRASDDSNDSKIWVPQYFTNHGVSIIPLQEIEILYT